MSTRQWDLREVTVTEPIRENLSRQLLNWSGWLDRGEENGVGKNYEHFGVFAISNPPPFPIIVQHSVIDHSTHVLAILYSIEYEDSLVDGSTFISFQEASDIARKHAARKSQLGGRNIRHLAKTS